MKIKHKFVDIIPDSLEENTIYVSILYSTVIHKCPCGCGNEVVTPLSPHGWQLTYDGETITLFPSIGNWSLSCRSHYWIRQNEIKWAESWSEEMINGNRVWDARAKKKFFRKKKREKLFNFFKNRD